MAELSPAAQQVFWEFNRAASGKPDDWHYLPAIAAALRAAADQVLSSVPPPCEDFDEYAQGFLAAHIKYRAELLAIAAELDPTPS
jgi:hypothetical protein